MLALLGALLVLVGCVVMEPRWRPGDRVGGHRRVGIALIALGSALVLFPR